MKIELWQLFITAVGYLGLLFLIAYCTDKGWIGRRIVEHPITYALSLGVYATSWTYYGSVGLAAKQGYTFLTIYLGVTLVFLLTPIILVPILRLVREYQLTSLADLLAFRYHGSVTGFVVTLFMLVGTLPYISLQIRAVTESIQVITQETQSDLLALGFCGTLTVFAILFGARHIRPREKHGGLVVAIAFESAVKLFALLTIGLFAVFGVFGGFGEMNAWLVRNPNTLQQLYHPVAEGPWITLMLLAFSAAFLLPRQFHMTFTENINPSALSSAAWIFPLFLLLLNLPIVPILWAGKFLGTDMSPDLYVLGITLGRATGALSLLAFIGGVSAASAMVIVTSLALATMCLNHLILPLRFIAPRPQSNLYRWVVWGKRILIGVVIAGGYGFYRIIVHNEGLAQLGLISFVAVAQLLPGVLALLFWPRANQVGFLCGLLGGGLVWFGTLIVPLLVNSHILSTEADFGAIFGPGATSVWTVATFWSLAANALLLVLGSLLSRQTREEKEAALTCTEHSLIPLRGQVSAASPADFQKRLARVMGTTAADQEVAKALDELQLPMHEHRPAELRLLRERIERNLSGLLGPALARMVVGDRLQLRQKSHVALADSIRFMEERLQDSNTRIRGVVAELDHLRRYHRQVLHELPIGVCALGPDGEVVIWNFAMQVISGVDSRAAIGNTLDQLSAPWNKVLGAFAASADRHLSKQPYTIQNRPRWLNLHKAEIETPGIGQVRDAGGLAILVEDRTELETLEAGLTHSERLASIGRLAAGVAHEIGNPLTGIACLAQNLEAETDRALVLQSARGILSQTKRISSIVRSLLTFSHPENMSVGERAQFELRECAEEAIRLVRLSHRGKNVECANRCDAGLKIHGDRQRILQVLVNLLSNACDASQPGDQVAVGASGMDDTATIRIRDQGQGIPEHLQEHIFEPFFTTKNVGEGTGLGLSLVHNIVRDHDGSISVRSNAGWGTEITIRLPCEPKAQPKVMVQ